jgi:ribosomal-protein-alanine N-acetyltransferase
MSLLVPHQIQSDLRVHVRWMLRLDLPAVLAIEQSGSAQPWTEDDLLRALRRRNCIGMVAEHGARVVGSMLYELHPDHLRLLAMAVDPESRRRGVGRQMVAKLVAKLSPGRRALITFDVRETHLDSHRFLHAQGFEATGVLREHFGDTHEDAYRFVHRICECSGR